MADDPESILVIILDTNPVWWGQRALKREWELYFSHCLDAVMVFCNAHMMLSHKNSLAVIAAHSNSSKFLYAKPETSVSDRTDSDAGESAPTDGKYELFAQINTTIKDQLKDLILNDPQGELYSDSLMAGVMCRALCYINRLTKENPSENKSARILVIKGSEDNPSQYLNLMNVIFTAQKHACDITGGIYLKLPQLSGLLQYLLWVFLPDPKTRNDLTLPPKVKVDYRAACFCHRNLVDIGYVCSVCLSIFCNFSPICSTCQTTFKFLGPPKLMKKKVKKTAHHMT
ncbi:hypothetical protein LSH36_15g15019 [Paralvinella palmiformis]|uniref:General transcription factor IIH subunit 3 n=1 Tax=Paralvinella palmiformis TaxID=53620 RepID=A0AAD9NHP8_9ANNE|nr:hypothetical protein LSH36_15g15019 [Paralvinella palmiformis]